MKKAIVVIDLGFGDSGKGTLVDALVRRESAGMVVRFNGGAQAGHNVVDDASGKHHCFSQFGAGTFVPGCKTLIGYPCLVNPLAMFYEEQHLVACGVTGAFNRMYVDGRCLLTTPYHRVLNRLRELSREAAGLTRHGSCGMGIGETVAYHLAVGSLAPCIKDCLNPKLLRHKLEVQHTVALDSARMFGLDPSNKLVRKELDTFNFPVDELVERYARWARLVGVLNPTAVAEMLNEQETLIFEGAQGVLLDEVYGFQPHVTWSKTTAHNANCILDEAECRRPRTVIGVLRAYATRHGNGPFLDDHELTAFMPDKYNPENPWQTSLRCGWWDFEMLRYSARVARDNGGLDALALTCLDQVERLPEFFWSEGLGISYPTGVPTEGEQAELTKAVRAACNSPKGHRAYSYEKPGTDVIVDLFKAKLSLPLAAVSKGRASKHKTFTAVGCMQPG